MGSDSWRHGQQIPSGHGVEAHDADGPPCTSEHAISRQLRSFTRSPLERHCCVASPRPACPVVRRRKSCRRRLPGPISAPGRQHNVRQCSSTVPVPGHRRLHRATSTKQRLELERIPPQTSFDARSLQYSSRILRLSTFPLGFFGRLSQNTTLLGDLTLPSLDLQRSMTCS